ncbi:hypothetical protein ACFLTH_04380 [Bacteroidota bacterium]
MNNNTLNMDVKSFFSKPANFFADVKKESLKTHIWRFIAFVIISYVLWFINIFLSIKNQSINTESIQLWRYLFETPLGTLIFKLILMAFLNILLLALVTLILSLIIKGITSIMKINLSLRNNWIILVYSFVFTMILGTTIALLPHLFGIYSFSWYTFVSNIVLIIQYALIIYFVFLTVKGIRVFKVK